MHIIINGVGMDWFGFAGCVLLIKVIAATVCVTMAASKAARLGATQMAAFQICLQLWLTLSLIGDALAVAGQVLLYIHHPSIFI